MSRAAVNDLSEEQNDVIEDIDRRIFGCVKGFREKYFENKLWTPLAEEIGGKLADFPLPQSDLDIDHYLVALQEHMPHSNSKFFRRVRGLTGASYVLTILPETTPENASDEIHWQLTSSIGIWHVNETSYLSGFLELVGHARKVFSSQPTRLFLHGFYIVGKHLELWLFDRSGIYCCPRHEVGPGDHHLATTLASYLFMDKAKEFGNNSHILHDNEGDYLMGTSNSDSDSSSGKLYLDAEPFWTRGDDQLIDDGLSCYKAAMMNSRFVVKFKWVSRFEFERERSVVQRIGQYQIPGIVHLFDHQILGETGDIKNGLEFTAPRKFLPASTLLLDHTPRSILHCTKEVENAQAPEEKVLACLVTYPVGRPIFQFDTTKQLLLILRDAIVSHRCLYQKANVLHQDISTTNIMIASSTTSDSTVNGLLIDFDSAQNLSDGHTTSPTGTRPFMAVDVLKSFFTQGIRHTYRHDLESFFYVFLHLAVCERPKTQPPATSRLRQWTQGKPIDQYRQKSSDMEPEHFEAIIREFTVEFHGLCDLARNLRTALFPSVDGKVWVGTDESHVATDALYDQIIGSVENAMAAEPNY